MGEDQLDKFMKNKVFDHETPTDADQLWQGILDKQVEEEKPKRRLLWFWVSLGLLIVGLSAGYLFFEHSNEMDSTTPLKAERPGSNSSAAERATDIVDSGTTDSSGASSNDFTANGTTAIDNSATTREQPITTAKKENSIVKSELVPPSISNTNAKATTTVIAIQKENSTDELEKEGATQNDTTGGVENAEVEANAKKLVTADLLIAEESNNNFTKVETATNGTNSSKVENNLVKDLEVADSRLEKITLNALTLQLSDIALLPYIDNPGIPEDLTAFPKGKNPINPIKKHSPFSIGAHFSYGFADRQLKNNNADDDAYLNQRNQTESAEQVLGTGIDIQYQFKSGFFAKTGLQYEQITERFDIKNTIEEDFLNENIPTAIYHTQDGGIDTIFGSGMAIRRATQEREIYNRYQIIDLPLMIGYTPNTKKRLNWFVEGGVLLNLTLFSSGEILDVDGETIIDLSASTDFKKNIGLSLNGGVGLSYRWTKKMSLWASPKIRYGLGSLTSESSLIEQRYWRGALELGVRVAL